MMRASVTVGICLGLCLVASDVRAAEGSSEASAEPEASGGGRVQLRHEKRRADAEAEAEADRAALEESRYNREEIPWIKRWRPERNMVTLGIYGGIFLANPDHDFYDPITRPQEPLWAVSPDVGLRAGFYPLRVLGVEAEFSANPTRVRSITNDFAFVYGFRGHAVAQLPFHAITPFFLAGYGAMGVRSNILILGDDLDPAFHYGGGVKFFFTRWVGARVEARNIISAAEARQDSGTSHVQVLAGLTFTFNRSKPKPLPPPEAYVDPDRDHDGFPNESDECPDAAGVAPHGCPDTDGDGFRDSKDACPEVPGVAPEGCPDKDTDGDGFMDSIDGCIDDPENFNGFEDEDGCSDKKPDVFVMFEGALDGIEFEFGKATIRPSSKEVLDKAVAALTEYDGLRVKITGHTDNVGDPEANLQLSRDRAAAVKTYMTEAGIADDRIETDGKGDADPRDSNETDEGRARNRRIEFEILVRGRKKIDGEDVEDAAEPEPQPSEDDDGAEPKAESDDKKSE